MTCMAEDTNKLKELLYRVEADRLQLQQQAAGLAENKQLLTADVLKLREQLDDAHAAVLDGQKQISQLSTARCRLEVQVQAATTEYRANDIIAIGLRDQITRLQHQLRDCQNVCSEQAAEIATFADDMASLRACKSELTKQLSDLQVRHQELQQRHTSTEEQLARAQQDARDIQHRWVNQHGDQARELQAVHAAKQQAANHVNQLSRKLEEEQQLLAQQRDRCAELEAELSRIRELVLLLGTAIGRQPGVQQLPSHDDPVWLKLGPLGGVAFALDTAIKHTREQHARVRELQSEFDKMEDRARAESAQKADLQSELYDARTMYAKAVAVREALEARTTRAEAERAAAEASLQQARTQAGEDSSRLTALQDQIMSLTQQVQVLQPLQPKLSTTEVERDTALHKLERLQEQYDQLQRQLHHATTREAGLQAEVEAYKLEHSQLLAANTQLITQCTELNKEVQFLEVNVREGSLAKGQLEEAKRKLNRTKTQLQTMTDRHVDTLNRLENTKELLTLPSSADVGSNDATRTSRPVSAWSRGSRPTTAKRLSGLPGSTGSSPRPSPRGSSISTGQQQQQQLLPAAAVASLPAGASSQGMSGQQLQGNPAGSYGAQMQLSSTVVSTQPDGNSITAPGTVTAGTVRLAPGPSTSPAHSVQQQEDGSDAVQRSTSQDIDALLRQRELERVAAEQQEELCDLQDQLQQQQEQIAQLEVQLLQQEAQHLQELQASEQATGSQCLAAAAEAVAALQTTLQDLQQAALQGPHDAAAAAVSGSPSGSAGAASDESSVQQPQQQQKQCKRWLRVATAEMVSSMQAVMDQVQARAQLVAARQHVGVQSDEPVQVQWLRFMRGLSDAAVAQPLHLKAASEALVRIYVRGLSQLEAHGQQRPAATGPGGGGSVLTVLDLLMAHYTPSSQLQQPQGRLAVQPYSAALWADPQGPITRLLLSCRSLAGSSTKVVLFCCLVGTLPGPSGPWGVQHWQQFLLLLHAAKQLTGGLWKGVLRDWATAGGALLPLQCVLDLLGNVYNANSLAALEVQPALLGSKQQLLDAMQQQEAGHRSGAGSRPGTAGAAGGAAVPGAHGGGNINASDRLSLQPGSVSAALQQLLVDGPLGPASAVDFDDVLAMLMVQFDAGLLPQHPLLQPRRLTTGDLANTSNAWGSAATEAAAGGLLRRPNLASPVTTQGALSLMAEASESARSAWSQGPSSPGGFSTASNQYSRPTTGATTSRAGTAAAERNMDSSSSSAGSSQRSGTLGGASVGSSVTLPRIKTQDDTVQAPRRSSSSNGAHPSVVQAAAGRLPSPAGAERHAPSMKRGVSMARVAFKDAGR